MHIRKGSPQGIALVTRELTEIARLSPNDVLAQLASSPEGLDEKEAQERLHFHGPNDVTYQTGWHRIWHYFERLRNDLLLPVLAVAVILIFIGKLGTAWIISAVLLASVFFTLVHINRSGKELNKLWSVVGITAKIYRRNLGESRSAETETGQAFRKLPLRQLVPGDVIALAMGDKVPADVRLIKSDNIVLSQLVLSGALVPVKKSADAYTGDATNPFDLANICLMGSSVVSGSGVGVVILTGTRTWLGVTKAWRQRRK